jgi:hypothetical protein
MIVQTIETEELDIQQVAEAHLEDRITTDVHVTKTTVIGDNPNKDNITTDLFISNPDPPTINRLNNHNHDHHISNHIISKTTM